MGEKIQLLYEDSKSQRLDRFLVELNIPELYSRSFIEKIISSDRVLVNLAPGKKSLLLKAGDVITLQLPDPEPTDIVAQDIPLNIVFEDEHLAVINKPAGLVVHPGFGNRDNTLVNAIVYHFGEQFSDSDNMLRPGIVHRLDRDTSGLMLIAKNDATQSALSELFANRLVKKTYLTVTTGIPDPPAGKIETFLARSRSNPLKMAVSGAGKWAITNYRILRYYHYFALVEIDLETGRMHQIRVHLAHRNYPVLGDLLYNTVQLAKAVVPDNMQRKVSDLLTHHLKRQALHAWKLSFIHPCTQQELSFTAAPPADFLYALDWLEQYFAVDSDSYTSIPDIN